MADKKGLQVLIQTYFGDVRDIYTELTSLPVDAIGLDFVEGKETAALVATGFPANKTLYAGIVNGKISGATTTKRAWLFWIYQLKMSF